MTGRGTTEIVDVDVERTALQHRFFEMFAFDSLGELLAAVDGMTFDLEALARCRDVRDWLADGWVYWLLYTKGWLQYRSAGDVLPGNVYFEYLFRHYLAHGHNPAMRGDLEQPDRAAERVRRRFRDFDKLLRAKAGHDVPIDTIRVTVSDPPPMHPYRFHVVGGNAPIVVRAIDGWHRMYAARLVGVSTLRCEVVHERLDNDGLMGVTELLVRSGDTLVASGWCLDATRQIYNFELRLGGRTIAAGTPVLRPDIAAAHPDVIHAASSGYHMEAHLPPDAAGELIVVGLQDIVPVGAVRLGDASDLQQL